MMKLRHSLAIAVFGLVVLNECFVLAQESSPPASARVYRLHNMKPAEAKPPLETLLSTLRENVQIFADEPRASIVVWGSPEAHRLTQQFVDKLNRPLPSAEPQEINQPGPPGKEAVLESYAVPASQIKATLTALRKQFPKATGAKFAVDSHGGQILALASPKIQSQVANEVKSLLADGPTAAVRVATPAPGRIDKRQPAENEPQQPVVRRALQLRHIQSAQLESKLAQLWQRRLPLSISQDQQLATLTLPHDGGRPTVLSIDRPDNEIRVQGPQPSADAWAKIVQALDAPTEGPKRQTAVVPLRWSDRQKVQFALAALRQSAGPMRWGGDLVSMIFQQNANQNQDPSEQPPIEPQPNQEPPVQDPDGDPADPEVQAPDALQQAETPGGGVIGDVQIEFVEGLDIIIVRGNKRDVQRVMKIIEDIERLSAQTEPVVEIYQLKHASGPQLVELVNELFSQFFAPRFGRISMNALVKPNAVLLIGRADAVAAAKGLIDKLDQPVPPQTRFQVFRLQHMPVLDAELTIRQFYEERAGLDTQVIVMSDYRSNSLVVSGSPRDLAEIGSMLQRLDVADSKAVNELRVFRLRNSLAEDLAPVIQSAIRGDDGTRLPGGGAGISPTQPGQTGQAGRTQGVRSTMLKLLTIDQQGGQLLSSGILTDVQVTPDVRANALVVRGPSDAMNLIAALIDQLDQLPSEAQIKVFTIINGDAAAMTETLNELFGQQQIQGQPGAVLGAGQGESSLVPLRFSVDLRTNTIIASGSSADLQVVEAILLRLDESDIRTRQTVVIRLKNSPALDVATAINEWLRSERQVQQLVEAGIPFEQIEREVVVVPEPVSNSLIVSASPRFYDEVRRIVEQLDERPPMVLIQVLIAEVALDDANELGVELGIQDSLLFDRSAIIGDILDPGFNFNNRTPGNSARPESLATRENLAGQALTTFALGRSNMELGYGGLVLSAGNESINVLIRALQDERSLQVLSRPQVMTLDNQPAFVQVGQRVPRITSSNIVDTAIINNTVLENVGILLGVTPRIAPDGQVVMEIDAENSRVGPEEDGIPISINQNGDVIRSPRIDIITAQTTVSARSGQTVILGGLITKRSSSVTRRVPYLSDVPVVGNLFRYDSVDEGRAELLFIMTPYIIRDDADIEWVKHVESQRMSWCLADVVAVHGQHGLTGAFDRPHGPPEPMIIYPDELPAGGELIPSPQPNPSPPYQLPDAPPEITPPLPPTPEGVQPTGGGQGDGTIRRVGYDEHAAEHSTAVAPSRSPRRWLPWRR